MTETITRNQITFIDAQAMRLLHTKTFEAPSKEDLDAISIGDYIKICVNNERFWVHITGIDNDFVKGRVDNYVTQAGIKYNDIIEVPKHAIFNIIQPPPGLQNGGSKQ